MMRVATYNAGLATGVLPNVTQRLPQVVSALANLDVDLLFVQEFWLESHWQRLVVSLQGRLPHTVRPRPLQTATPLCNEEQLAPLKACADAHCAGLRDEALARCVVRHCASTALRLPTECLNCIASTPEGTLEQVLGRCTGRASTKAGSPPTSRSSGAPHGGLIAYGGSLGTGMLLRERPIETAILSFESSINARGAIFARVHVGEFGTLPIFAAHLSPGGQEQPPQVDRLMDWIGEKAGAGPAILLGDLNTTPDSALFERFRRLGFHEGEVTGASGTYSSSGLESGRFTESAWRLDHVLVRGRELALRTSRILDQPVTLEVEGRRTASTLSDHAGLFSIIAPSARGPS
jgi:endonuclease/exonuclease/phosphatase family metal-dependent hydrolase